MTQPIHAIAAHEAGGELKPFEYKPAELRPEEVEIAVEYCGVCHSDLSMLNNDWGMSKYPLIPGHEVVGRIVDAGPAVPGLQNQPGDPRGKRVGLGWGSSSCMLCTQCLSGFQNLCKAQEATIVGRHGGFATRVRCHWAWAIPLVEGVDPAKAGPLFCGGVTVFNPLVQHDVSPTARAGVIGIGGLGHMAVQFLNKWGCEVYAFSSSGGKQDEVLKMGAHHVVATKQEGALQKLEGKLDFLLSTVNVTMDWPALLNTLAPKGHLHLVGVAMEPLPLPFFPIILQQRSVGGTPAGSPVVQATLLDFCARHQVGAITEEWKMSEAQQAMAHLKEGKPRYRIVLKNDLQ